MKEGSAEQGQWEVAAAGRAAGRAAAADDRDMELAELDSRIVAALNRARASRRRCCEWEILTIRCEMSSYNVVESVPIVLFDLEGP